MLLEIGCSHLRRLQILPNGAVHRRRRRRAPFFNWPGQVRLHEASAGGGGDEFRRGRRIQVSQNHVPPNSYFSSNFGHLVLEILENSESWTSVQEIFFEDRDIWENPTEFGTGRTRSPHPRWRRPWTRGFGPRSPPSHLPLPLGLRCLTDQSCMDITQKL